ncbi:MAG: type I secretion C-terminal target domain-containing protein [Methylococcaceae bacterium]|nr:type I secretion C-terminal target domain-containing protein [Methylococcaceae bacterium]
MTDKQIENKQEESLNLQDLLIDEKADGLSEYLSLSIENLGENTRVSVTTVEDNPVTYSSTLNGVLFSDLQQLIDVNLDLESD